MICEQCGTVFCWDDADTGTLGGSRRRFCSKTCQKHATPNQQAARKRWLARAGQKALCAERGKKRYPDAAAAVKDIEGAFRKYGLKLYSYQCACGWWHLCSTPSERYEMAFALKRALFGDGEVAGNNLRLPEPSSPPSSPAAGPR